MTDFERWVQSHDGASPVQIGEQLEAIPVGRWGVAGCRGSGWDPMKWSPHGNGGSVGPGTVVKRLGPDEYLIGSARPTVTLRRAIAKLANYYYYKY